MEGPVLETLSESLVKPSTSTPPSLRYYKLCYHDQIEVPIYVPMVFFYPNLQASDGPFRSTTESETSQILQVALSNTLSYYYPFAGRLRNNLCIECNDMGVHFIAARIKCSMSEFLQQSNPQVKDRVIHKSFMRNASDDSLVFVQISYFNCSGMAVSISMSHKLGDASTLSTFTHDWATMVRQSSHIPSPKFIGASLFPPLEDPSSIQELALSWSTELPLRKYLFSAPKIGLLKDMVAKLGVKNPTRVEVVSALLYRCAIVSSRAISSSFRPAILVTPMNLRPISALPKDSIGNLIDFSCIATIKEEEMTLPELVSQLRNAKVNVQNKHKGKEKANGSLLLEAANDSTNQTTSNTTFDFYSCSSWCRIPFYDVDFGRGKPLSVGTSNMARTANLFTLMDYRGEDSIEAIVSLKDERHMSAFETNEELLAFASLIS